MRLRDNLAYCLTGGHAVFLDMDRGRYFMLPAGADEEFRTLSATGFHHCALSDISPSLRRADILVEDWPSPTTTQRITLAPARTDLPQGIHRASLSLCARALAIEARAAARVRLSTFSRLISHLRALKRAGRAEGDDVNRTFAQIADAFSRTAFILPVQDRCVVRSLAYLHMVIAHEPSARLVVGVALAPFSAQCWVQAGECVLNDRYERVRSFAPILVL
jgi:hypothetical protein